jgi:hypothetical protein
MPPGVPPGSSFPQPDEENKDGDTYGHGSHHAGTRWREGWNTAGN